VNPSRAGRYEEFEQPETARNCKATNCDNDVAPCVTAHTRELEHPAIANGQNGT
jgi:hypothetical protein